jgi:hypothetical protein
VPRARHSLIRLEAHENESLLEQQVLLSDESIDPRVPVCLLWRLHGSETLRTLRRCGTGIYSHHIIRHPAGGSIIARGTRAGYKVERSR